MKIIANVNAGITKNKKPLTNQGSFREIDLNVFLWTEKHCGFFGY